jgi:drug/metabolite transporter (DMT)-like permease
VSATLIAIACGLGAAACFGTGDFLAQRLTHRHGWMPAMFAVQIASVIVLAGVALVWHGWPAASATQVLDVAGLGLINTLGMIGLYRAFESGKLSLVSPIAGSMGAFTIGFAWMFGRSPPAIVAVGLLAAIVGIVAASVVVVEGERHEGAKLRGALGVGWALLSAIGFGWVFFRLGPASVALGSAWAIALLRVVAIVALVLLARPLRARLDAVWRPESERSSSAAKPEPERGPSSRGRTLAVACLDSAGMVTFAYGSGRGALAGEIAVVAVLASSFPLVTIALARFTLGEALRWWQWIGVTLVVSGVAWVSAFAGAAGP